MFLFTNVCSRYLLEPPYKGIIIKESIKTHPHNNFFDDIIWKSSPQFPINQSAVKNVLNFKCSYSPSKLGRVVKPSRCDCVNTVTNQVISVHVNIKVEHPLKWGWCFSYGWSFSVHFRFHTSSRLLPSFQAEPVWWFWQTGAHRLKCFTHHCT